MIRLIELTIENGQDIYDMLQRIGPSENAFRNDVNGMSYPEYQDWLSLQAAWARGEQLPDGYVKQWTYWLYDNDTPVGYGKLRERATEQSLRFGGNLGMAIDPLARGKGYGNLIFQKLLEQAAVNGIKEVFSTVEKFNWPSKKIHEKMGGKLVKEDDVRWYFLFDIKQEG